MDTVALLGLRPMRVAELLDATIRLYRKNFWTFVAIIALLQVPLVVINGLLTIPLSQSAQEVADFSYTYDPETFDPDAPPEFPIPSGLAQYYLWMGVQLLVSGLLGAVATSLMTGALAWAVSERHLDRPISVGLAYRAVFRRWKSLLGATVLTLLIYLVLYIVVFIPCIGQLLGLPALIFSYVCLRFVPQAVMVEGQRAGHSLGRSWYLTKPHFWRVLGIVILLWLLGLLITAGPSLVVNIGIVAVSSSLLLRNLVATVVSALLGILYLPIRLGGETLLYYDLRVRQEGLDLELEIEALVPQAEPGAEDEAAMPIELPPAVLPEVMPAEMSPEATRPLPPPVSDAREPFLTGRDARNLIILIAIGFGIMLLCCFLYFGLFAAFAALTAPAMEQIFDSLPTLTPSP